MTNYTFYDDPGHGWLAVERKELKRLGILEKISRFSYQQGEWVYLEEDCDATAFVVAKKANNEEYKITTRTCDRESPIRNLPSFYP